VLELQQTKRELADASSTPTTAIRSLSREDLELLLLIVSRAAAGAGAGMRRSLQRPAALLYMMKGCPSSFAASGDLQYSCDE